MGGVFYRPVICLNSLVMHNLSMNYLEEYVRSSIKKD